MLRTESCPPEVAAPSAAGIFPLPLTVMESFLLADGRPGYPMLCDFELQFSGSIDRPAFEAALAFALERNPLFRSLVNRGERGALTWVPTDRTPAVDWAPLDTPLGPAYNASLDLEQEIGLRVWVRQGTERSTVLLHFHHACSDGLGAVGFVEDFLAGYANNHPEGQPVTPRAIDAERLLTRGLLGITRRTPLQQCYDLVFGIREGIRFFRDNPLSLAPSSAPADSEPYPFLSAECPAEIAGRLTRVASAAGSTLNDLLMRDLMLCLERHLREGGTSTRGRRLRILMPQSLREAGPERMSAGNAMSFAFVTRTTAQCAEPEQLLKSITQETALIRAHKLSLYFLGALASVQSAGLLGWLLKRPMCFSTAVLTNLSDPSRRFATEFQRVTGGLSVGNLVYLGVTGTPPVRPLTGAAFAIYRSASSLTISLKCDPRLYRPLDAQRLLGDYVKQLHATADSYIPEAPSLSAGAS